MDFRITEDQGLIAQSVREYLTDHYGVETLRRLEAAGRRDPEIWAGLVSMGYAAVVVPESEGGLGLGLVEGVLVALECGRACLAEPLVDIGLVRAPWLVAKGRLAEAGAAGRGEDLTLPAHPINGWSEGGAGKTLASIDPLRRLVLPAEPTEDDPLLLDLGALMASAQLIGLAEAMLAQASAYAKVRTQFGQPIGAFQAVKHQLASCAVAIEFARPVVLRAAAAMNASTASAAAHVSHAKVAASDAALLTAETAIQAHGAMGYTYEVDLHFWVKRAWALSGAWGERAFHLRRLDEAVIGGTLPIGPEHTFA